MNAAFLDFLKKIRFGNRQPLQSRNIHSGVFNAVFLLGTFGFCLFGYAIRRLISVSYDFDILLRDPQTQWMLFACIAVWCGSFIALTFSLYDLALIGMLLIAVFMYTACYTTAYYPAGAIILLAGVTFGKGARLLLSRSYQNYFIMVFVLLLTMASWCHLDMSNSLYHGPRWTGLWSNPNTYGMLMGTGLILSICLLMEHRLSHLRSVLYLAAALMGSGLLFSYSRGALCGVVIGLLYLGRMKTWKFNRRFILLGFCVILTTVWFFWNLNTDHWYLKRLDLSSPSVQNRVAAWKGAIQIIRDHPWLGVGWNRSIETYEEYYTSPLDGSAAIATNAYLMLGTQLGLPVLLCFVVYMWNRCKKNTGDGMQIACRAGALVLLTAFWFDGGLFELATAAPFWILLEFGGGARVSQIPNPFPSPAEMHTF